jgi:hypothetical protein
MKIQFGRRRPGLAADQGKSNNGNPLAPSHDTLHSFERGSVDVDDGTHGASEW